MLEVFCQAVNHFDNSTTIIPHQRKYFGKTMPIGDEPVGSLGGLETCDSEEAVDLMFRSQSCFVMYSIFKYQG